MSCLPNTQRTASNQGLLVVVCWVIAACAAASCSLNSRGDLPSEVAAGGEAGHDASAGAGGSPAGGSAGMGGVAAKGGSAGTAGTSSGGHGGTLASDASGAGGTATGGSSGSGGASGSSAAAGTGGSPAVCGDGTASPGEACDDGYQDACGSCNADCTGPGTQSVCGDKFVCPETEKCDEGPANGCGVRNNTCTGPGGPCSAACAGGAPAQTFQGGMVGCKGMVTFPDRASLCAAGSVVCTSEQWVSHYNGVTPTYDYWTSDGPLYYVGYIVGGTDLQCAASNNVLVQPTDKCPGDRPMRVCTPSGNDAAGNTCDWTGCGWLDYTKNHWFGGCNFDYTAGALCCLP